MSLVRCGFSSVHDVGNAIANESELVDGLATPAGITEPVAISKVRRFWRLCSNACKAEVARPIAHKEIALAFIHNDDRTKAEKFFLSYYKTVLTSHVNPCDSLLAMVHEDFLSNEFRLFDLNCALTKDCDTDTKFKSHILDSGVTMIIADKKERIGSNSAICQYNKLRTLMNAYALASCFDDINMDVEDNNLKPSFCMIRVNMYCDRFLAKAEERISTNSRKYRPRNFYTPSDVPEKEPARSSRTQD